MMAPVDGSGSWPACRQTVLKRARGVSFTIPMSRYHVLIAPKPTHACSDGHHALHAAAAGADRGRSRRDHGAVAARCRAAPIVVGVGDQAVRRRRSRRWPAAVPAVLSRHRHRAPACGRSRSGLISSSGCIVAGQAAAAVARPPQADPRLRLHRLRAGAAAGRRSSRCCAGSRCSTTSARIWCRAGCARSPIRRDSSRRATALEMQRAGGRDAASILPRRQTTAGGAVSRMRRRCRPAPPSMPQLQAAAPRPTPRSDSDFDVRFDRKRRSVVAPSTAGARSRRGSTAPGSPECSAYYPPRADDSTDAEDTHLLVRGVVVSGCAAGGLRRWSSICSSTTAIRQQLRASTGVELKTGGGRSGSRQAAADAPGSSPAMTRRRRRPVERHRASSAASAA